MLSLGLPLTGFATTQTLTQQVERLPPGFVDHVFDTPTPVRLHLNGKVLGDGMVILRRDDTVELLEKLGADTDAAIPSGESARWFELLKTARRLGPCRVDCVYGLRALHFSLDESLLSVVTDGRDALEETQYFHALPVAGSTGVILHNTLNVAAGQWTSARYTLNGIASLGNWTAHGDLTLSLRGRGDRRIRHTMPHLYTQRRSGRHEIQFGYLIPRMQGLSLAPNLPGSGHSTILGAFFGTSDALRIGGAQDALYPVEVVANRPAMAEVYRDGVMIFSQPAPAGVTRIDTQRLPVGIYDVDVRLVEDEEIVSTQAATIYKPGNWQGVNQRWRYAVFGGQHRRLFESTGHDHPDEVQGEAVIGGAANYLLHPRVLLGGSLQRVGGYTLMGAAVQWHLDERLNFFSNVFQTQRQGIGVSAQLRYAYTRGSFALGHNRRWVNTSRDWMRTPYRDRGNRAQYRGQIHDSFFTWRHRVSARLGVDARIAYRQRRDAAGVGVDLAGDYRARFMQRDTRWRLAVFDRPGVADSGLHGRRDRGVELSVSIAFGRSGTHEASMALGVRSTDPGGMFGAMSYAHQMTSGPFRRVYAGVSATRENLEASGGVSLDTPWFGGDIYARRSTYGARLTGGANLFNTVLLGGAHAAVGGASLAAPQAGVIIDVDTDIDDLVLRVDDNQGGSVRMRAGRNVVPVSAYKRGAMQFDFAGTEAPLALIYPTREPYHFNRGGVAYRKIFVSKTLTAMGRLLGPNGTALAGARVHSVVGRSVAADDGSFVIDVAERAPTMQAEYGKNQTCSVMLDFTQSRRMSDVMMVGDQQCLEEEGGNGR